MKTIARYATSFGLSGCYLPQSYGGAVEITTRRELASFIRQEIEAYELPKSLFKEVGVKRLWSFIKQYGSSSAHFCIDHKGFSLQFIGLTEEECKDEFNNYL